MREFSIYTVSIINIVLAARYCILTYKQKIKPSLAMWSFFTLAVAMSLVTYMAEGDYKFLDNILNTTDVFFVSIVTIAIAIFGDKSTKFNRFDKGCLIVVVLIIIFWAFTQHHLITNALIQAILVIAYFPVVKRLWKSKENTEPFSVWIGIGIAPVFALLSSKGVLASIYSWRAVISVALLLILMLRLEYIKKKRLTTEEAVIDKDDTQPELKVETEIPEEAEISV